MSHLYIGTSGWNYRHWKDDFYAGVPQRRWLEVYAEHFLAVEVNATFYRLQARHTFEHWRDTTPPEFRFAIKGNRYLTHNRKLRDPLASIHLERERAAALGDKLAVLLWQLPRNLHQDRERLEAFAEALGDWPEARHVLEFRHPSWFDAAVAECLAWHRLAVCQSDAADWPLWDALTTDLVYVRLHGHERTYASGYDRAALERWSERIGVWLNEGRDVHVYFDNDAEGAAPRDARHLIELTEPIK